MNTLIQDLLDRVAAATDESCLAEAALEMAELVGQAEAALEFAKVKLREIASQRMDAPYGNVVFESPRGTIAVNTPKPSLQFTGSRDELRHALGDLYDAYFREKVTVSPVQGFRDKLDELSDERPRSLLVDAVAEVDLTPRVSFRPRGCVG